MASDAVVLAALVILLLPMGFFLMSAPAFLLVKLDIPEVSQLLRGVFNSYFLVLSMAGAIGAVALALAGRFALAVVIGLIAAFAIRARDWFLQRIDTQITARDAGDADAVRQLRRLHWGGMLSNAAQLVAVVTCIPYFAAG